MIGGHQSNAREGAGVMCLLQLDPVGTTADSGARFGWCRPRAAAMVLGFGLLLAQSVAALAQTRAHTASNAQTTGVAGTPGKPHSANDSNVKTDLHKLQTAARAYQMSAALAAAQECRDSAYAYGDHELAAHCNLKVRDASRYLGDARTFLAAAFWESQYAPDKMGMAFSSVDLERLVQTTGPLSASIDGGSTVLYYMHALAISLDVHGNSEIAKGNASGVRPEVGVKINRKLVPALIDTGTLVPLVLDQAHAYLLGAIPLVTGIKAPGTFANPAPLPDSAAYELVRSFKFGTLVMHNVLALVVKNGTAPKSGVIVGLPVLARYGQVTFTRSSVHLSTVTRPCKWDPLPLTFASRQAPGLVFPVHVGDTTAPAMFDTGMAIPLVVGPKSALASASASATAATKQIPGFMVYRNSKSLSFRLGKVELQPKHIVVSRYKFPADIDVGAPMLVGADIRMNFVKPSICFMPPVVR